MRYYIDLVEGMNDQLEETSFLTEMDWYEKSAMAVHLKRYVGQNLFIHFTNGAPNRHVDSENADKMVSINVASTPRERARARKMNGTERVPKIGVNPSAGLSRSGRAFRPVSTHGDPIGVYFYPVDFLFTASDRLRRGGQFGLNFNYYYVCRIDKSGGGIDLSRLSMDSIANLADANGWLDQWEEFMAKPEDERLQILGLAFKKEKGVGSFFWAFMQRVMHAENLGWNKLLKTVTYIEDPGLGIIHSHEPAQIVALRPDIIRVIEQGETEPARKPDQLSHQDTRIEWEFAMKNLFKRIRGEYGGEVTFKNKEPTLVFKAGSAEFTCLGRYERGPTLHVTYQQGRATGSVYMDSSRFSSKTTEEIVEDLQKVVTRVARRKSDLVFQPSLSIDDAVKVLTRAFGQTPTRTETEIRNEASQINVTAEIVAGTDRIKTMGRLNLRIRPDELSLTGSIEINNKPILSIYAPNHDEYPPTQIDEMLSSVAGNLAKALKETSRTYLGDHNRRYNGVFDSPEDFQAFVGWFAINGGFDFDGKLKEALAEEVAQFENADKSALESQMGWAFGGR